jgi:hypothetical protein
MNSTFIITSAINTSAGIYAPGIRILQTIETINSIQEYYPDARILLVEGGKPIPDPKKEEADPRGDELGLLWHALNARCHVSLSMSNNEQIRRLHDQFFDRASNKSEIGGTTGLTKTLAELTLMSVALNALKNHEKLKSARLYANRIFKISGRYQLSPLFDPSVYEKPAAAGKYVFRRRQPSPIPNAEATIGTAHGYSSRLWSFAAELLDETIQHFDRMIADYFAITATDYIDMEHLLFKHIGPGKALELEHTHVYGTIAPNGIMIYD